MHNWALVSDTIKAYVATGTHDKLFCYTLVNNVLKFIFTPNLLTTLWYKTVHSSMVKSFEETVLHFVPRKIFPEQTIINYSNWGAN